MSTGANPQTSLLEDDRPALAIVLLCSVPRRASGLLMVRIPSGPKGESPMIKAVALVLAFASFLLVAPVIESGTSGSTQIFQAIGTADGGAGE
jgi:hypothetical protein